MDLSKAFDSAPKKLLLTKLKETWNLSGMREKTGVES